MKKSKAIFGVSTNDVVEQIKIDSCVEGKNTQTKSSNQKVKTLIKNNKNMRRNIKNK